MQIVRLKVNDQTYDKLIWLLSKFSKEEVEIINDNSHFTETQAYLRSELIDIDKGNTKFVSLAEADARLERVIKKHENSL